MKPLYSYYISLFPEFVSDLLIQWTRGEERPQSGSLVKLVTQEGKTRLEFVK